MPIRVPLLKSSANEPGFTVTVTTLVLFVDGPVLQVVNKRKYRVAVIAVVV